MSHGCSTMHFRHDGRVHLSVVGAAGLGADRATCTRASAGARTSAYAPTGDNHTEAGGSTGSRAGNGGSGRGARSSAKGSAGDRAGAWFWLGQ